jgi:hypothetical protein
LFVGTTAQNEPLATVEEGTTLELTNEGTVRFIDSIGYGCHVPSAGTWTTVKPTQGSSDNQCDVVITKSDFRDFFKVGDADAQVFRTK